MRKLLRFFWILILLAFALAGIMIYFAYNYYKSTKEEPFEPIIKNLLHYDGDIILTKEYSLI